MGNDVDSPWRNNVDFEDMMDGDFERRNEYLSMQDTSGRAPYVAEKLGEEWNISQTKAADRAVRMYLAHLLDTEVDEDLRVEYEISVLIPPRGWMEQFEPVDIEVEDSEKTNLSITVPPSVAEMVVDMLDYTDTPSKAAFMRRSLYWCIGEDE